MIITEKTIQGFEEDQNINGTEHAMKLLLATLAREILIDLGATKIEAHFTGKVGELCLKRMLWAKNQDDIFPDCDTEL